MEKLILECVVRSTLIALFTAIALYVLRVKAARVRHPAWAGVVVIMLALPVWTAWGPKAVLRVLKSAPEIVLTQPIEVTMQEDTVSVAPAVHKVEWSRSDYAIGLYLLGFVVLLTRLLTGTVRARILVRRAGRLQGNITSDACVAPITVGTLRPVVVLPRGWTEWTPQQLDAVLAHESEHVSWRDPLVQWLALFNRAVFWFHPLAWWLSRRLAALAEEACDDAVLAGGHDPVQYSECLLGLARLVRESGARVGAVGMAMPGAFLPQRIRRIVSGSPRQQISFGRKVAIGVAVLAIAIFFTTAAVGYEPTGQTGGQPAKISSQNVTQKITTFAPQAASGQAAATDPAVLRTEKTSPPLKWAPSWHGTPTQVFTGHVRRGGVEIAQQTVTVPGKPTDGFGAGFQTLSGTVMDPSNAVVANAVVTLADTNTGLTSSTTTTNYGNYQFQNIAPGTYTVTISAPGFKRLTQTGIHVAAGEAHNGGAMLLQLGQVSQSITVTGSRSASVSAPGPIGNPLGAMTSLAPGSPSPIGIPLNHDGQQSAERQPFVEQFWLKSDSPGSPIRIGGNVRAANIVVQVRPVYPPELQQQGVQGTVKIEAVITKEGIADNPRVISSPDAALTQSALDALEQWRYKPAMLNGEPVELMTTIDMKFQLRD